MSTHKKSLLYLLAVSIALAACKKEEKVKISREEEGRLMFIRKWQFTTDCQASSYYVIIEKDSGSAHGVILRNLMNTGGELHGYIDDLSAVVVTPQSYNNTDTEINGSLDSRGPNSAETDFYFQTATSSTICHGTAVSQ